MRLNPAQQIAYKLLSEIAEAVTRSIVQRGATAFADPQLYQQWRDWGNTYVQEKLVKIYGSIAIDSQAPDYWMWQLIPEHANLCHHLPWCSISLMRIQKDRPTDLIIMQPENANCFSAALGSGCFGPDGRSRMSKQQDVHPNMLCVGEGLPGTVRSIGSPLLEIAMVATGNIDAGCWNNLGSFPCAAAQLLVSESGGMATNLRGDLPTLRRTKDSLLIANHRLHSRLLPLAGDTHQR